MNMYRNPGGQLDPYYYGKHKYHGDPHIMISTFWPKRFKLRSEKYFSNRSNRYSFLDHMQFDLINSLTFDLKAINPFNFDCIGFIYLTF